MFNFLSILKILLVIDNLIDFVKLLLEILYSDLLQTSSEPEIDDSSLKCPIYLIIKEVVLDDGDMLESFSNEPLEITTDPV